MIITKILFLVLIVVCLLFYILYIWDFALVLLVVVIAIPLIMFVTTLITKYLIKVEFAVRDSSVTKNTPFPIQLVVTNRSIFPIGKAEARIEYYNVFSGETTGFDLYLPIQSRNSQRISFQLSSKFCGVIRIKTAYVNIFDPLKIFKFRIGKNISAEISVLPEGHEISGIVHYSDRINEESNIYSEHRPGDDPSEVFDLREYSPGDKLNRIHWKLSSKKDDFIVKDYSLPIDVPCSVFLDLRQYENDEFALPVFDTLMETLISLSQFLLDNERAHSVIYFNSSQNRFAERDITDETTLAAFTAELFASLDGMLCIEAPELYFAENTLSPLASFTFITSSPDAPVMDYIDENIDAELKNAFIIVKTAEEASKISSGYASLNTVPVAAGRISSSIKDIDI